MKRMLNLLLVLAMVLSLFAGTQIAVVVRGRLLKAEVVRLPFV
jgi:hypothetical protein